MRRHRRSRNDAVIDLTSLLDVIFIVLLAVIVGYQGYSENGQKKLENEIIAARDEQKEAEQAKDHYENMMDTADHLNSYVYMVSIAVPFEKEEPTKRKISVFAEDGGDIKEFELLGNDKSGYDDMKEYLTEYISAHGDSPVLLALNADNDKILYRDEKYMTEVLYSLSAENSNAFVKGYTAEVEP